MVDVFGFDEADQQIAANECLSVSTRSLFGKMKVDALDRKISVCGTGQFLRTLMDRSESQYGPSHRFVQSFLIKSGYDFDEFTTALAEMETDREDDDFRISFSERLKRAIDRAMQAAGVGRIDPKEYEEIQLAKEEAVAQGDFESAGTFLDQKKQLVPKQLQLFELTAAILEDRECTAARILTQLGIDVAAIAQALRNDRSQLKDK